MSIRLEGLRKSFENKKVLDGFSAEVQDGETLCIMGFSGAGKSVTLKHIIGLIEPDAGEIWVDGRNVGLLSQDDLYELRRQVGYVFQFAALFDSMTIAENVAMGLRRIRGMKQSEIDKRVTTCLELVDLHGVEDRLPSQLSGGMRKRAGLARAIATEPKYLLYDEPTSGLDPVTTTVIDRLIVRMGDELGVTQVVVTHDLGSAYRISDRIVMLHEGRNRAQGTPDEIRASSDPVVRSFVEGKPELMEGER